MIYYPLSTLMLGGIREIVVVTSPDAISQMQQILGDGSQWGLRLTFRIQDRPGGIADGLLVAEDAIAGSSVALILGDNIFYGSGIGDLLQRSLAENSGATVFAYEVANPSAFGIVTLDQSGQPVSLEEKPRVPKSRLAVTGLYFYDPGMLDIVRNLRPSSRGELEITDVNCAYLERGTLRVRRIGRGYAWLDGGTPENLYAAAEFVRSLEQRTGLRIACPEEIALRLGWCDQADMWNQVQTWPESSYRHYVLSLCDAKGEQLHT
jgi:glucose-1-phosphate thymidylyltransferase